MFAFHRLTKLCMRLLQLKNLLFMFIDLLVELFLSFELHLLYQLVIPFSQFLQTVVYLIQRLLVLSLPLKQLFLFCS